MRTRNVSLLFAALAVTLPFALCSCASAPAPACPAPPSDMTQPGPGNFRIRLDEILKSGSQPEETSDPLFMNSPTKPTSAPPSVTR